MLSKPSSAAPVGGVPKPRNLTMQNFRWQLPILAASIVLGVLITMQFRYQRMNPTRNVTQQVDSLVRYLEIDRSKLTADVTELRDKLQKYEATIGESGAAAELLKSELEKARMQAGLMPVKGPGVEVTMDDSPRKPAPDEDPYYYLIHDTDIQSIVNELWAAGAEAISVNDQRVVMFTSVRCVGPTVLVNSVRLTPPYVIRAVGAPPTLETALKMQGGVLTALEASVLKGVRIDVQKKNEMVLPEYKGSAVFRYASAVSAK